MLKLTNLEFDEPIYVPLSQIKFVSGGTGKFEGRASLSLGGGDYVTVRESADEVAKMVDEATCQPISGGCDEQTFSKPKAWRVDATVDGELVRFTLKEA